MGERVQVNWIEKRERELEIIEKQNKGPFLNSLEKFHIFKSKKENKLLNDIQFDINNPIYKVIEQFNPQ
jgi:hypothetical protein